MIKKILLLLCLEISCNVVFAQVEFNYTGILGLGYRLDEAGGFPIVPNTIVGSPAYIAGIKADDRLLKINDQSLSGITLDALTEKFKIPMGVNIKILVEHADKTQQEVVLKKAGFITAAYKYLKYQIFFDENKSPLTDDDGWIYYSIDGINGIGYYVYDPTQAFFGEFENSNRKEGLYYYVENGKPYYYLGEFANNKYSGKGMVSYGVDGDEFLYTGDFMDGYSNGNGSIKNLQDGHVFTGSFKAGKKEGYGKETTADGTLIVEGQFKNGVLQTAAADETVFPYDPYLDEDYDDLDANGYPKAVRDEDLVAPLADNEAEWKAAIIARLDKFWAEYDKAATQQAATQGTQTYSGSSSSALDHVAAGVTAAQQEKGWLVDQSYNTAFSSGSPGQCSASCNEKYRLIYVFAEADISSLKIGDLEISMVQKSNDINEQQYNKSSFDYINTLDGIAIYAIKINIDRVNAACSYRWNIYSGDTQAHTAKIAVLYGGSF